jgi:phenylacetate-coenzyme A ligase PaaK-like adenylate-forming protein
LYIVGLDPEGKARMIYWNPYLETLSRERLLELELNGFRKLLQHAKRHCPFYCQRYKDIVPEDIKMREDLWRLPILDKEDLQAAQEGMGPSLCSIQSLLYAFRFGISDVTEITDTRRH